MIIGKHLDPRIIAHRSWKRIVLLATLSSVVFLAYERFGDKAVAISTLPAGILGIAIAFLIGFRVNAAYERWWEARKVWGAILNDSRTFARQVETFFAPGRAGAPDKETVHRERNELFDGQIAFAYALKSSLRGQDVIEAIRPYAASAEIERLRSHANVPNAILQLQEQRISAALGRGLAGDLGHMQISETLTRLCDSMGAAERIKSTVFPRQYSYYSSAFTLIYSCLLPFILVGECGWMMIPFTILIGFIFHSLDSIAGGIENPFSNTFNDIPMDFICRTLEINLRQMNGETNVPQPVEAVNGALM